MNRRHLLMNLAGLTWFAVINPIQAQLGRRKRLGYLSGGKQGVWSDYTVEILKASLRDLGWHENGTIEIVERWANGDASHLPDLARELVQLQPDVIAATGTTESKALQNATKDIPVVFLQVADPISSGLVATISRPGGNITGLMQGPQILWSKRLGLLTEMIGRPPRHVAWLGNPGNSAAASNWADATHAVAGIGADLIKIELSRAEDLELAFKGIKGADG